MSDLLEKLRTPINEYVEYEAVRKEAADEIERLRAATQRAEKLCADRRKRIAELEGSLSEWIADFKSLETEYERLRVDLEQHDSVLMQQCIDKQQQYLNNKDSVIKGMNEMITKLEGDLEVMRLQRDAKRWTKP